MRYRITIEHIQPSPGHGGLWVRNIECADFETTEGVLLCKDVGTEGVMAAFPLVNIAAVMTEVINEPA